MTSNQNATGRLHLSAKTNDYYTFDTLSLGYVRHLVYQPKTLIVRPDYRLQVHHTRLKTFTKYGCYCWACKRTADIFKAECHITEPLLKWYFNPLDNSLPIAHINLYGIDQNTGDLFMMTSDHVKPWSLGGSNGLSNRVPLCESCNTKKGNDPDWLDDLPRNKRGILIHRTNHQIKGGKQKRRKERYYA